MKKELKQQIGDLKKKFKMGRSDFEPGTLINKLNDQKAAEKNDRTVKSVSRKEKVAIMGMV